MKKVIILIPVFNDWESLQKLIIEIDMIIKDLKEFSFECLVINDASTIISPKLSKPKNFKALKVLNMKQNKGHARCNAFGLKYICKNEKFNYVILMDGDGEDRPVEIKSLAKKILENPNESVVAKRMKRSEGIFFQFLYQTHKLITLIFTGKKINFGNYSCLIEKDVEKLSTKSSLWSSFSGSFKKNVKNYNEIESFRGVRYFGPSKMSLYNLLIHSFSIIAVFRYQVFLRSFLIIIVLNYLKMYLGTASIIFQIMIIIFNFIIFVVSFREKEEELINSHENLRNVEKVTH
tara:strand:+ start:66 stop:938 length:873 start_codon:yes stop_codon:yes gene_type:complete